MDAAEINNLRQMIATKNDIVRCLLLSKNQIKILKLIAQGIDTTKDISQIMRVSDRSISVILGRLYKKGYLSRGKKSTTKGGITYIYSVTVEL